MQAEAGVELHLGTAGCLVAGVVSNAICQMLKQSMQHRRIFEHHALGVLAMSASTTLL